MSVERLQQPDAAIRRDVESIGYGR